MAKKKVLLVTGALCTGGAEKVARDLGLCAPGDYEIHYLVFETETGDYESALIRAGCRIHRIKHPRKRHLPHFLDLLRLLRREGFGAVHSHTMFHCGLVMLAGRIAGVPVRIAHAHSELREGGPFRRVYEGIMGLLIRSFATHRVACSESSGRRLFGKADFRVIPNGIRQEKFAFDAEARQRLRQALNWEGCFVIGHVGRLHSVKNQRFLVKILPDLREIRPDARLLLVGDGPDRENLKREVSRRKLEKYVHFAGNIPEVGPYYSAMDRFAFPSFYEGMPLALLEARCSGLSCAVSDRVSEEGGLPLEDPDAWVRELAQTRQRCPGRTHRVEDMVRAVYEIYEGEDHD